MAKPGISADEVGIEGPSYLGKRPKSCATESLHFIDETFTTPFPLRLKIQRQDRLIHIRTLKGMQSLRRQSQTQLRHQSSLLPLQPQPQKMGTRLVQHQKMSKQPMMLMRSQAQRSWQ